jgi:DNA-binding Lrp family transcriptional regulator
MNEYSLDGKDRKILTSLKKNSRLSIRELASQTKIRPSTVHQRMKKMVQNGVIEGFTLKVNDEKVGEAFTVFMLISGSPERYLDEDIMKNPHVKGVYGITGEYDLFIKMKFKDMKEFNDFLLEFREKYARSIAKTLTMVQTVKLKEE